MRKVKFTQDTFDEKLGAILTEFPILDVRPMICYGFPLEPDLFVPHVHRIYTPSYHPL
jgi:hypothetical protein